MAEHYSTLLQAEIQLSALLRRQPRPNDPSESRDPTLHTWAGVLALPYICVLYQHSQNVQRHIQAPAASWKICTSWKIRGEKITPGHNGKAKEKHGSRSKCRDALGALDGFIIAVECCLHVQKCIFLQQGDLAVKLTSLKRFYIFKKFWSIADS